MIRILKMLKPYRGTLILSIIFSAAYSVLQILIPIYTKYITSEGIIAKNMNSIIYYGAIMLGLTAVGAVTSLLNTYFSTRTSVNYAMNIRSEIFSKVSYLSGADVDALGVSSLMTRTTNDVRQVHDVILSSLKSLLPVPIMLVGGFIMAYSVSPSLLRTVFMAIPVLLLILIMVLIFIMPMYSKIQKFLDKLNFILRGKIGGIRVVRAFNRSDYEDSRFDETNSALTKMSLRATRIMSSIIPVVTVGMYSLICYIMYICVRDATLPGTSAEAALETIPNMYMFLAYFMIIFEALATMLSIVISLPKASVSAKRLNQVLDVETQIKEPENPVKGDDSGTVEFRNVCFRYKPEEEEPKKSGLSVKLDKRIKEQRLKNREKAKEEAIKTGNTEKLREIEEAERTAEMKRAAREEEKRKKLTDSDAVHDLSFTSKAGETTAIIGLTGCGKTTLVNLIPRLYDVSSGQILVDGVDVRDLASSDLHKKIAYVPQQSYLFSGTVKDNVKFGNLNASDSEVWHAVEIAQAKTFVSEMPEGIDSFVSQAGKNYSGGQKQRLAIARAVVKDAEIYIFDDSFSALDLATDARLRASLKESLPNANIIIVAQRVGTVINADRIIVMDKGKAVGIGTHSELMESCEVYQSIVRSQLSEEEEAAAV
ncbi:MAG: ATP-binding cassette domain-containing protein [Clostridiales bacterium]|nr:ATP-binding cassette domain-containing protein [Clostridiales bacterium]